MVEEKILEEVVNAEEINEECTDVEETKPGFIAKVKSVGSAVIHSKPMKVIGGVALGAVAIELGYLLGKGKDGDTYDLSEDDYTESPAED